MKTRLLIRLRVCLWFILMFSAFFPVSSVMATLVLSFPNYSVMHLWEILKIILRIIYPGILVLMLIIGFLKTSGMSEAEMRDMVCKARWITSTVLSLYGKVFDVFAMIFLSIIGLGIVLLVLFMGIVLILGFKDGHWILGIIGILCIPMAIFGPGMVLKDTVKILWRCIKAFRSI